jgi:hypothetical protein
MLVTAGGFKPTGGKGKLSIKRYDLAGCGKVIRGDQGLLGIARLRGAQALLRFTFFANSTICTIVKGEA